MPSYLPPVSGIAAAHGGMLPLAQGGRAVRPRRDAAAIATSVKAETPEELEVSILERRDVLTDAQREILNAIEGYRECSRGDLLRRFPKYSESELHYRLEQLRSFMFITVTKSRNEADPRYRIGDSYREAYHSRRRRSRMSPPPGFR